MNHAAIIKTLFCIVKDNKSGEQKKGAFSPF